MRASVRRGVLALATWTALALVIGLPAVAFGQGNGRLQIHFISVGEGDAAVLISPRGEVVLFDSGVAGQCSAPVAYLQSLGITAIDVHVASSYRDEHIGCAAEIFSLFGAPRVAFDRGGTGSSAAFSRYAAALGGRRRTVVSGQTITLDAASQHPVRIGFLGLDPSVATSDDAATLVSAVHFDAFDAVIGGDLGGTAAGTNAEALMGQAIGQVEVYKVHGHGSAEHSSRAWLDLITPRVAVVSTGTANPRRNPTVDALDRLRAVGAETYWTSPGNGATAGAADIIGSDVIVEAAADAQTFSVTTNGITSHYPMWNRVQAAATVGPPIGTVDTPAEGAVVAGEVAFTGWALDDSGILSVLVYRAPFPGEPLQPNGLIYVGDAQIIEGARPDVAAAFPAYPGATRAGWGLMVLSNMLPNKGSGTYTLYAYANSMSGETKLLGTRKIVGTNQTSVKPFGTIDTPLQGATVSGTIVNFGWVLTPQPRMIPTDGSTIDIYIDNVLRGHPVYNNFRPDIASLFPGYANSNGAVGYFMIDTTTLGNGVHTIVWVARDNGGNSEGMGSRFFTVQNEVPELNATLKNASETTFNAVGQDVQLDVPTTITSTNDIAVFINHVLFPRASMQLAGKVVTLKAALKEGKNDISFHANDNLHQVVGGEFVLWAGSRTITGTVKDNLGAAVVGANLLLQLGDDKDVTAGAVSATGGAFTVKNVPDRTIFITATASGNRMAVKTTTGAVGSVAMTFQPFQTASPIQNNDFSQGVAGWNIGTAPVTLVAHAESNQANAVFDGATPNTDLRLNTSGEGPQTITRTFVVKPGTTNIKVRYKFVTSEVPGGYFGSDYNDSFSITMQSKLGGGFHSDTNAMNEMGLAAFSPDGATDWREAHLAVSEVGDTIEVKLTVSNIGDGLYDSYLLIDGLSELALDITTFNLYDLDNKTKLDFLSADPTIPDTYQGGFTQIHGRITIVGTPGDSLQSLSLEIVQDGEKVATAELAPEAQGALLKTFDASKTLLISTPQRLFRLTKTEAAKIDGSEDSTLSLRVRAQTANGDVIVNEVGTAQLLVRYTGTNRFNPRDENLGGDDWATPWLRDLVTGFGSTDLHLIWNDFSNMNGGPFPHHSSHKMGIDVDGYFDNYNNIDAKTAEVIIGHLNNATYGKYIEKVFVKFDAVDTNKFWMAIKDVTLGDMRKAKDVILPDDEHPTHFHWRIIPK